MTIKKLDAIIKNSLLAFIFFSVFNITNCYAVVSVGDSYGGGTVFCVSQTPDITQCVPEGSGDYGLIMANEDQANFDSNPENGVTWASKCDAIPAAQSDDDGAANTAAIIAALPEDNPSNNAAWLCYKYQGGGEEGWYLPSKNELKKMYLFAKAYNLIGKGCSGSRASGVQCLVGGYDEWHSIYWSSTEYLGANHRSVWVHVFSIGDQYYFSKIYGCFGVRAVRAFNELAHQQFKEVIKTMALGMQERLGEKSPAHSLNKYVLQDIAKYLWQVAPAATGCPEADCGAPSATDKSWQDIIYSCQLQ